MKELLAYLASRFVHNLFYIIILIAVIFTAVWVASSAISAILKFSFFAVLAVFAVIYFNKRRRVKEWDRVMDILYVQCDPPKYIEELTRLWEKFSNDANFNPAAINGLADTRRTEISTRQLNC